MELSDDIIGKYKPLIASIIRRHNLYDTSVTSFEDYMQAGLLGLAGCFKRYAPEEPKISNIYCHITREIIAQMRLMNWRHRAKERSDREVVSLTGEREEEPFQFDVEDPRDYTETVITKVILEQLKRVKLTGAEQKVAELMMETERTLSETAKIIGVTPGAVGASWTHVREKYRVCLGVNGTRVEKEVKNYDRNKRKTSI